MPAGSEPYCQPWTKILGRRSQGSGPSKRISVSKSLSGSMGAIGSEFLRNWAIALLTRSICAGTRPSASSASNRPVPQGASLWGPTPPQASASGPARRSLFSPSWSRPTARLRGHGPLLEAPSAAPAAPAKATFTQYCAGPIPPALVGLLRLVENNTKDSTKGRSMMQARVRLGWVCCTGSGVVAGSQALRWRVATHMGTPHWT